MKLTAQLKLVCSKEQADSLRETLERVNAACNHTSECGWQARKLRQYDLHKLVYHEVREQFGLPAQLTVRAIAKVADAYKLDKRSQRVFAGHGAIAYDLKNLTYRAELSTASISTLQGRVTVRYVCSERAHELMNHQQGESDLVYRKRTFYLFATCEVEEPDPIDFNGVLGVDLGIKNLAADSEAQHFSWLAGLVDGEGSFTMRIVRKDRARSVHWTKYRLAIAMTSKSACERCREITGFGTVLSVKRPLGRKPVWLWSVCGKQCGSICRLLLPYLVIKREQAELLIQLSSTMNKYGNSNPVDPSLLNLRKLICAKMHDLNR